MPSSIATPRTITGLVGYCDVLEQCPVETLPPVRGQQGVQGKVGWQVEGERS